MVKETPDGAVRVTGGRGRSSGLGVGVKVHVSIPLARETLPEGDVPLRANGGHPAVGQALCLGSNTDIGL